MKLGVDRVGIDPGESRLARTRRPPKDKRKDVALLDRETPLRFYSPGRLWSDEARAGWVEPDLQPLP